MTRARWRVLFLLTALLLAAAAGVAALNWDSSPLGERPPAKRPSLLLLTGLPLLFNEDFSISGGGSPALKRLATRYRLAPISVTDATELAKGRLLLMAQPQAQTAENLVTLDAWVRGGGRVLLLADPLLEWPSKRPLGDPLRPSPMFMDTGLLAHWGLRLDAPRERGEQIRNLGSYRIVTVSPGHLAGTCDVRDDGLEARCTIGKGHAIIVADADFLNTPALGAGAGHNLDALMEQLAILVHIAIR